MILAASNFVTGSDRSMVRLSTDGDAAPWSTTKLRKKTACADCQVALDPGTEAFRPVGNQSYRAARVCRPCVEQLVRELIA